MAPRMLSKVKNAQLPAKMSKDGVEKPKPKRGKVRFLENGLLDVERKGRYLKMIKRNSGSPLLSLPAEIRNEIYQYALGRKTFEIKWNMYYGLHLKTKCSVDEGHANSTNVSALLRICRQVYAETALLLYRGNMFSFPFRHFFDLWFQRRLPIQREAITTVQFQTFRASFTLAGDVLTDQMLSFPEDVLPQLSEIHIDVFENTHWLGMTVAKKSYPKMLQYTIEMGERSTKKRIKASNDKVKVIFHRYKHRNDCSSKNEE